MSDIDSILLHATSGTDALRKLLNHQKHAHAKWSFSWMAKRLELTSKGHIADILSGRRTLVPRLWQPCLELLELHGISLKYCDALLKIEAQLLGEEDIDPSDYSRLEALRKIIRGRQHHYSERIVSHHMILQVHSVFGLFANQPTRRQLLQFFGREHLLEVDRALHVLLQENLAERQGETYRLRPDAQHVMVLGVQPQKQQIVQFLQQGLEQSKGAMERWSEARDLACFRSAYVSVKKDIYIKHLDSMRDEMLRMQNEMSSTEGNMLVRIDFQVYPIGERDREG